MDLFSFMVKLKNNPRIVADYLPAVAEAAQQAEPRVLSRELRGTPNEIRECVVVYGFGAPLSAVVAVTYGSGDATADFDTLKRLYGIDPLWFDIQSA
jgi:hypothetical protein